MTLLKNYQQTIKTILFLLPLTTISFFLKAEVIYEDALHGEEISNGQFCSLGPPQKKKILVFSL